MIKRKYKFVFDVKIVKITTFSDVLIDENKEIEKNSMIENDEFERVDDEMISEHIKKIFFSSVSNSTNKKNSLRICRIINSIDYQAQNIAFHQRSALFIHTFDEIL